MGYQKKSWIDRQSEYPGRRLLKLLGEQPEGSLYDVSREEGNVIEEGSPFNQTTMNDLEARIAEGFGQVADGSIKAGKAVTADSVKSVTWGELSGKPASYPPSSHDHDNRYYSKYSSDMRAVICAPNAGAHNAIYRGKNLGTAVTAAQYAAISAGTFDDLYIGDYWTIGGVNYRIAAFDYYLNYGDGQPQYGGKTCTVHHLVMVPDTCLYGGTKMNASSTTVGGYLGSQMYTQGLEQAKTIIRSAFGEHLLSHRIMVTNAVSNGVPTGSVVVDSEVDLMNEQMVYGSGIFAPVSSGTNSVKNFRYETSQLPLFFFDRTKLNIGAIYWLRDVVNTSDFAAVHVTGAAEGRGAVSAQGVRPSFCIY